MFFKVICCYYIAVNEFDSCISNAAFNSCTVKVLEQDMLRIG